MDVGRRPVSADWRNLNLANWESRVGLHTGPDGYDLGSFDDPAFLSGEVRYDLPKLGRLDGLDIVHLQCHIGTDTVSLSRLGPRSTVGLDFPRLRCEPLGNWLCARGPISDSLRPMSMTGCKHSALIVLILSSPVLGRCAGFPVSAAGPMLSQVCCGRAGGCSCGNTIRCCGR